MTSVLAPADFAAFFKAVWNVDPFPWQQRLLEDLARRGPDEDYEKTGCWPDVLDLPTGSGKTAALDIALFHLALEADRGSARRAPVRIALVVDRRLIVDDAAARAKKLARVLKQAVETPTTAHPIVLKVAQSLVHLAGAGRHPLVVRRLRGGTPIEEDWAHTPVQPTILCSTVDQVGSRLLFRGYGISDRMKPIHAGLLGSDCLLLLDEAHLSEPFRQTLSAVRSLRSPDTSPFGFALLTATPGTGGDRTFGLEADDRSHPVLSTRLAASKPARLIEIVSRQGVDGETSRAEQAAAIARSTLETLLGQGIAQPVVGVVVNRVARARAVFERLSQEGSEADTLLLIGPSRSAERQKIVEKLHPIRTGEEVARSELRRPLIVVATQTIEAGVDLDFDGLITEAASLDALRQRFGRLNRAGREIAPVASILASKSDIAAKADDVIYGDRIARTWGALGKLAVDDLVDFGIDAFRGRLNEAEVQGLAAPFKDAPVLMPAYVELWSQTWPIPSADPEAALFLHGPDTSPASVEVVWRADVTERDLDRADAAGRRQIIERLRIMPPRSGEAIQVSLWAVRTWLAETDLRQADLSDAIERTVEEDAPAQRGRPAFRWAGADSERSSVVHAGELRAGDLVVVPCTYGGCDAWGWNPQSHHTVRDVADDAQASYRSTRYAVRVTPELIGQALQQEPSSDPSDTRDAEVETLSIGLAEVLERFDGDADAMLQAVTDLRLPQTLQSALAAFTTRRGRLETLYPYGYDKEERPRGVAFLAARGLKGQTGQTPVGTASTETEEGSTTALRSIALIEHSADVRDWAQRFCKAAGLDENVAADVALASFLHDAGKADPRFQAYLAGGDPYGPDLDGVLAKSGNLRPSRTAWANAGLPDKWRHEALSVRLARLHPDFKSAHDPGLVLWLIGTHHGFGRPLFPHADSEDTQERRQLLKAFGCDDALSPGHGPQSLAFDFEGADWPQLFAKLKKCYGAWGLARLEGFVRLADHRASESGKGPDGATDGEVEHGHP